MRKDSVKNVKFGPLARWGDALAALPEDLYISGILNCRMKGSRAEFLVTTASEVIIYGKQDAVWRADLADLRVETRGVDWMILITSNDSVEVVLGIRIRKKVLEHFEKAQQSIDESEKLVASLPNSDLGKPPSTKRRKPKRKQKKQLKNAQHQVMLAEQKLEIVKAKAALFEDNVNQIQPHLLMESTDIVIGRVTGCTLIEVRKGARITERTTNFSSMGSSGSVRIGRVSLGGSSRNGSSHSTSVSFPAPDELQIIDTGTLILSTKAISFVGNKFSRSTPFSKMLQIEIKDMSVLIASSTSSKVWICEFGDDVDLMIAGSILAALWNTRSTSQNKADYFEEFVQAVRDDIGEQISEVDTSLEEATLLQNHLATEFLTEDK